MSPLYTVRDEPTGMSASVFPHPKGFAVVLRDDDCAMTAGVIIYPPVMPNGADGLAAAKKKADEARIGR